MYVHLVQSQPTPASSLNSPHCASKRALASTSLRDHIPPVASLPAQNDVRTCRRVGLGANAAAWRRVVTPSPRGLSTSLSSSSLLEPPLSLPPLMLTLRTSPSDSPLLSVMKERRPRPLPPRPRHSAAGMPDEAPYPPKRRSSSSGSRGSAMPSPLPRMGPGCRTRLRPCSEGPLLRAYSHTLLSGQALLQGGRGGRRHCGEEWAYRGRSQQWHEWPESGWQQHVRGIPSCCHGQMGANQ